MAFSFAPQLAFLAGPLEAISAGRQYQSIRIVYRDIGTVDSAMEQGEAQPRIAPPLSEVFELPA